MSNTNAIKITKNNNTNCDAHKVGVTVAELASVIWHEHFVPIIGAEQVEYMLERFQSADRISSDIIHNNYTYFTAICEKAGTPIGYCAVCPMDSYLLLSKLYILKDYRGLGIARRFLNEVLSLCAEQGIDRIRLTVNKYNYGSISAYQKMGFVEIDSVKTDIGGGFFMDDYVMERCCTNTKIC